MTNQTIPAAKPEDWREADALDWCDSDTPDCGKPVHWFDRDRSGFSETPQ